MGTEHKDGLVHHDVDYEGRHPVYTRAKAILSEDLRYRYSLTRTWNDERPRMIVVMLNPSTATGFDDDPTIRRCVGFAQTYGMGELQVLNLYAFRTPSPKELFALPTMDERVGPRNDEWLETAMRATAVRGGLVVVGWGAKAEPERVDRFLELSLGQWCWDYTKDGSPKHPLYIPGATALSPWPRPA